MWKLYGFYFFLLFVVQGAVASENIFDWEKNSTIENYIGDLVAHGKAGFKLLLTKAQYQDNGKIKTLDSLAFVSQSKNESRQFFTLSTIPENTLKTLVTASEDKGMLLSMESKRFKNNKLKSQKNFTNKRLKSEHSIAEEIILNIDSFETGFGEEIAKTIDSTETQGILQVLDYFEDGKIKRKTTSTAYPSKIHVQSSSGMSDKMQQESKALLRKAYKVNLAKREILIAHLFNRKYTSYSWAVLTNSTAFLAKSDVSVTMVIGVDKYDILGVKNVVL